MSLYHSLCDVVETLHQIRIEMATLAERFGHGAEVRKSAPELLVLIADFGCALV